MKLLRETKMKSFPIKIVDLLILILLTPLDFPHGMDFTFRHSLHSVNKEYQELIVKTFVAHVKHDRFIILLLTIIIIYLILLSFYYLNEYYY